METLEDVYWRLMKEKALTLVPPADGCSGVSEWKRPCCLRHDVHYRTGYHWKVYTLLHNPDFPVLVSTRCITRREADDQFFSCMKKRSRWWMWWRAGARWAGVRGLWFPSRTWNKYRKADGIECP